MTPETLATLIELAKQGGPYFGWVLTVYAAVMLWKARESDRKLFMERDIERDDKLVAALGQINSTLESLRSDSDYKRKLRDALREMRGAT